MYVCITYYTKIRSKRKFKIRNIKLSKISLPTVLMYVLTTVLYSLPTVSVENTLVQQNMTKNLHILDKGASASN